MHCRRAGRIGFDDKLELMAGEIGKVRTDGGLTAKVMVLERRLTRVLPKFSFGFGRVAAQEARARHALVG
jgi:hypothetical protein